MGALKDSFPALPHRRSPGESGLAWKDCDSDVRLPTNRHHHRQINLLTDKSIFKLLFIKLFSYLFFQFISFIN